MATNALEEQISGRLQKCQAELEQTRAAMRKISARREQAASRVKGCEETISALQKKADDFENQLEQIVSAMVENGLQLEEATKAARKCADESDRTQLQADLMRRVHGRLKAEFKTLTDPGRPGAPKSETERIQQTKFRLKARLKFWEMVQAHAAAPSAEGEKCLITHAKSDCYFSDPERVEANDVLLRISRNGNLPSSWKNSIF